MDKRLKSAIQWTLYIAVIVIAIMTLISLAINMLAPTFFPNKNISGFKEYINTSCIFLSFLSVGLGIYSIWQASESGKQANEMVSSIKALKQQQELLCVTLTSTKDLRVVSNNTVDGQWIQDNVKK